MALPPFVPTGDLPIGVHRAALTEVMQRFGGATAIRRALASRLNRIWGIATSTGMVARFVLFGSFVTSKPEPNDVDIFMLMDDAFDAGGLTGESRLLFEHGSAQTHFGASVFWMRKLAALEGEQAAVEYWQVKRDGSLRGIVEIVGESP
jgi:hypothetical protein